MAYKSYAMGCFFCFSEPIGYVAIKNLRQLGPTRVALLWGFHLNFTLIDVYSSSGERLYQADSVTAKHLLMSGQVKRCRVDHVPSLKYYLGVDPDDGPLVASPADVQGGNGVIRTRVFVSADKFKDRDVHSSVYFEHEGARSSDPARVNREREKREKANGGEVHCRG